MGRGVDLFPLGKLLVWIHKRLDLLPWTARLKLSMTLSIHLGENIKKLDSILSRDLFHRIYIFGIKQLVFKTFWIFFFLYLRWFYWVAQTDAELLNSSHPPASAC